MSWNTAYLISNLNTSFTWQEDNNYEQSSDVRTQLKFFEQLDQLEKQRKEEQEREILLKAAKVQISVYFVYRLTLMLNGSQCLHHVVLGVLVFFVVVFPCMQCVLS